MKTFLNLIEEVQKPGLCHHCGGCVSFCTAINYGALELDENGMPRFSDRDKCIECGLCSLVCVSKIPIFQYIKLAKYELGRMSEAEEVDE